MKLKKDSTQQKVKREKSRKEVIILETAGILLLVLSFACILLPVYVSVVTHGPNTDGASGDLAGTS